MDYVAIDTNSFRYLEHYGVLGMKWGIRRYQNSDGSLTAEGRKRAKREYKEDNEKAFRYGAEATVTARAYDYAARAKNRADAKYLKNPSERNKRRKQISDKTEERLKSEKSFTEERMKKHYDELVKKYGNDAVSTIKYDEKGRANEKINRGRDYVEAALLTVGSRAVFTAIGSPFSIIYVPPGKETMGRLTYKEARRQEKRKLRKQ